MLLFHGILFLVHCITAIKAASYLYIDEPRNYLEGRQLCNDFGLDLAKVSSESDIDDLHAIYSNISGSDVAWIGLKYADPLFFWPDGSLVQHSHWNNVTDDEPDNLDICHCAVIRRSTLWWHTRRCSSTYPVLCGPYLHPETTPEVTLTSFTKWREGYEFIADPTIVKDQLTPRACAKDCLMLDNCMFFSQEDAMCKMYSDITSMNTQNKTESQIWKRNTITIEW